mgnify:CR=1 FL=1
MIVTIEKNDLVIEHILNFESMLSLEEEYYEIKALPTDTYRIIK